MPVNESLAHEQWTRFQYCRDMGHLQFLEKAEKCDKFLAGEQWRDADVAKLQLQQRPALTINKIIPTVATVAGQQIYNRAEVTFRPKSGAPAETADALNKVWMQISQNNQLPWVRSDVFFDGIVRSRGFFDVRLDFNDSMQGEVRISLLNSKNVIVDPDAEEYDPDSWSDVFLTKWVTPQDISILYNDEDAKILANKDGSSWAYGYDSIERVRDSFGNRQFGAYGESEPNNVRRNVRLLERQYRKLTKQKFFVDVMSGDMRAVPDGWDRNRIAAVAERYGLQVITRQVRRIRWTVTADDIVLHDDWSPYKHFTTVPYFPYFQHGRTIGLVENLLGPQELLNKTASQELHVINTTANSGWVVRRGSLINMTIEELENSGSQTGLVLEVDDVGSIDKIQPNQIPQGLERLTYKAEEYMKTISNVSDSMQGFDREDVAAKAIQAKQSAGSINFTKMMDNLERTDFLLARNVLDIVQEYYTEERLINITHDNLTQDQETLTVNQPTPEGTIVNDLTIGEYDIVITSAPFRATMEDSQFEQARALRELGVQIPDDVLIENSRLVRKSELVKRMSKDTESPEAKAQAELESRARNAEVAKLEAEAADRSADAQLKTARAQKESVEAQGGEDVVAMRQLELSHERELIKIEREHQLQREKMERELALKREQMQEEAKIRRIEMAQRAAEKESEPDEDD